MRENEYYDLDAALGEVDEKPLRVRFAGLDLETPRALSAKVMLSVLRAQDEGKTNLDPAALIDLLEETWGAETLEAVLETGVTLDRFMAGTGKLVEKATAAAGEKMMEDAKPSDPPGLSLERSA